MLEAAREIAGFVASLTPAQFEADRRTRYAVERQLLVIGEAARNVSDALKQAQPAIPWQSIVGQRNVLAHEYGEVLVERVWLVATERIPELIRLLEPLVPPPPPEAE
jgi:uncharacterized protein with HEPN domain